MQGFVSRLAATRRRQGNQEKQVEDVYAEEEEQGLNIKSCQSRTCGAP